MRRFRDAAGGRGGRRVRRPRGRRAGVPVVAGAVLLLGLSACGDDGGGAEGGGPDIAQIQGAFDRDEPGTVTGKKATLSAEVEEVVSPSAFEIVDEGEPMLVVAKEKRMPDEGDEVRVTGTVREFDIADVRERLGADMSEPLFREHKGEPYLWAERIEADIGS
jgi:hypothetical protein